MNAQTFIKHFPFFIFISLSILGWFISKSYAANYNVYFNNIEQGNNSQASPTLNVPAEKPAASRLLPKDEKLQVTSNLAEEEKIESISHSTNKKWRLGLLAQMTGTGGLKDPALGATLSMGYFPFRALGLNIFGNLSTRQTLLVGTEIEVVPLTLSLFDFKNFLEVATLIGASRIQLLEHSPFFGLHAGLRTSVNFGERFGIAASARINITDRKVFNYVTADAGLMVRL